MLRLHRYQGSSLSEGCNWFWFCRLEITAAEEREVTPKRVVAIVRDFIVEENRCTRSLGET